MGFSWQLKGEVRKGEGGKEILYQVTPEWESALVLQV